MIYLSKIMGYIWKKIWDILGKNYCIYFGIYWFKIVGLFGKTMGYTSPMDILIKIYGIY